MGLMRPILDEMMEGNYKFRNSTSLSGIVRVCTEYGVKPSANYFAVGLDAVRFLHEAFGGDDAYFRPFLTRSHVDVIVRMHLSSKQSLCRAAMEE